MIASVGCTSCASPRVRPADVASKSKEAALQQQIDAKSMQEARTTCNETAGKIGADIAALKSQLAQMQFADKSAGGDAPGASDTKGPTAEARYQEF